MSQPVAPPAVPPQPYGPPAARSGRAIGTTAFVVGMLAFVGDIVAIVVIAASFITALGDLASLFRGDGASFAGVAVGFAVLIGAVLLGSLLGLAAVVLGIIGAVTDRGRVLAILGIVFGGLVLLSRLLLLIGSLSSSSGS